MSDIKNRDQTLATIAMILTLVLSYLLDLGYFFIESRARETFTYIPVVLIASLFPFGVAFLVLVLAWFSLNRPIPRTPTFLVYFLVGLITQLFLVSYFLAFPAWLRGTIVDAFMQVNYSHGLISNFSILSASLVIIGLVGLLKRGVRY